MAIEIYYTKTTDKSPRKWYDANRPCRGSIATWMCFMHYMERKYLPSYPSAYSLKEYNSRFTATMFWNGEGDCLMQGNGISNSQKVDNPAGTLPCIK